jgi:hypothetical protein
MLWLVYDTNDPQLILIAAILKYVLVVLKILIPFVILIWLVIHLVRSRHNPKVKKNRRTVLLITALLALGWFVFLYGRARYRHNQELNYKRVVAVEYAQQYDHSVILPKNLDYKLGFDMKWPQVQIKFSNLPYLLTQVPLTERNQQYFVPANNICDFFHISEDDGLGEVDSRKACGSHSKVNEFDLYINESTRYAYISGDGIVAEIMYNSYSTVDFSSVEVARLVQDLYITDKIDLIKAINSDHFSFEYSEVLDRWYKDHTSP